MNLLEETTKKLEENGHSLSDIVWVGCPDFKMNLEQFFILANKAYDNGYGGEETATDLLVVGEDWWLERHEYDGAEWWEYKKIPTEPDTIELTESLFTGWMGLRKAGDH
ncbi:hypothetical protein [Enterococcus caccae]|uniref:Uncharacterized protein n=1 Tax=Enterococcus caccae ATCC BAA-1240 TaxID=1158612 RepID=R3WEB2_9ENTE|nr:hypothetical protein [Enterococcus caccae]EOL45797.1 hypothetical protein UC7_01594 [Enterococcus caccae ATCC BAA-1240]EOT60993.1 hypothetical protein I580_01895 [Enterococcus caccae ATCC BAA-1240]OJG27974.1 hypothetical protein RU98_GL002183 [Enterococcus caccae]